MKTERESKPDQVRSPRIIFIDSEPAASLRGINFQFQPATERTKQEGNRKRTAHSLQHREKEGEKYTYIYIYYIYRERERGGIDLP